MIKNGSSTSSLVRHMCPDLRHYLNLLAKQDKTVADYESLCLKDGDLSFQALDQVSLKYVGQVRMLPVYGGKQQGTNPGGEMGGEDNTADYEVKQCGYGKLIWPDGSTFEGYWINGQACGIGVFCGPPDKRQIFEGYWQQDKATGLCVFRQSNVLDYYGKDDG